jgi:prepilin-type N-terminal cleavage/methylation domain-containing protein
MQNRKIASSEGFTLLELLVVIILLGGVLLLALPRFTDTGEVYLKTDSSRVSSYIRFLNEASATKKVYYRISFDLGLGEIRAEYSRDGSEYIADSDPSVRRLKLREGVAMEDIVTPATGKVNSGVLTVVFAPSGTVDPFTLHLRSAKKFFTLTFNPYSGAVNGAEGYV